ncbi:uncharacterized protein LOC111605895 [Xiphophorus maculatus]|uniref:uncharacterized protein LOC111605895 n=1 Tax=Xiphophorus maculatus TaxID=8083 RepID=UPI000C6E19DA|nr:uncharacterized protein LOC111605895 [Xiphophorus maculatus]
MDVSCVLSVNQFLYVSRIYKDKLQRILDENEVEIRSEVVKFESKRKDGKPNEAKTKFVDLVQDCLADFSGSVFSPISSDPDQLNRALEVIMNKESKLLANISSKEIRVFGPNGQRTFLDSMLKPSHKTSTGYEESERWSSSSNISGDLLVKINMTIKDDLADEGLTIDKNQWKNLKSSYDNHLKVIKAKFNVDFKESSISEGKVNVKPSYKGHGGNPAMENHAVRALLHLYLKTSPMPLHATRFSGSKEASNGTKINSHLTKNREESVGEAETGDNKDDKYSVGFNQLTNKKQLKWKHESFVEILQTADDASAMLPTSLTPSVNIKAAVSELPENTRTQDKVLPRKQGNPYTLTAATLPAIKVKDPAEESCLLSLNYVWYISRICKEGIKQIERKNKIKMVAQAHVTFKAEQEDGNPHEARNEFINLSQSCSADSGEAVIPLKFVDPDQWSDALKVFKRRKDKLLLTMSSDEVIVSGPKQSQDEFSAVLNAMQKTNTY